MEYYKLRHLMPGREGYVYLAAHGMNEPYLFYNTACSKKWAWGVLDTWEEHHERKKAQIVSELEVLVACGSVPDDEAYMNEHFPTHGEV